MTTQTILSSNLLSGLATSDKTMDYKSKSGDFNEYMSKSLSASNSAQNTMKKTSYTNKSILSSSDDKQSSEVRNDTEKKLDVKKNDKISNCKETEETAKKTVSKQEKADSDISNNISNLEKKLKEIVKDALDLSDEELEDAMSVLGLQMIDLLNPDNLKSLALLINGENDISAILTNEDLANKINHLLGEINNISLEENLSLTTDQINQYLAQNEMANQDAEESTVDFDSQDTKETPIDPSKLEDQGIVDGLSKQGTNLKQDAFVKVERFSDTSSNNDETTASLSQNTLEINNQANTNDFENENQGKQFDTNATETFIQNLANATMATTDNYSQQVDGIRIMREIVNQIVEQVKVTIKPDSTSMQMNLNPESLGKLNLSVTEKNGVMTAQFLVENETAREAIESQLSTLKQAFESQGLKVESVEVTVSNFTFDQSNQAGSNEEKKDTSKRKINIAELSNENKSVEDEAEILTKNIMEENGSSVNFKA